MYIHIDYSSPALEKEFPKEFGEINRDFFDDEINKINCPYFINDSPLFGNKTAKCQISEISKINFLVGANNSGKSRFLRGLFKINTFICTEQSKSALDLFHELQEKSTNDDRQFFFEMSKDIFGENLKKLKDLFNNSYNLDSFRESIINLREKNSDVKYLEIIDEILDFTKELKFHSDNNFKSKFYIPILRSIISDPKLDKESFDKILETKYGLKENTFTGLKLYDDVFKLHNSENITKLEEFTSWIKDNFYPKNKLQLIPDLANGNLLLRIDDEMSSIFNIGDGVQQLILLLFPIFTSNDNTWCFIEEPETHLHPGLQRIFIETILNNEYLKSKNLMYFFTTHSNHFLDLSLHTDDISIFQFHKENRKTFKIKNVKPNKETLDLLGVNNSSVLMANSSIWVEGPTDRKYISFFLKLYCTKYIGKHLKEDIDFAFFEYGGNLIEHYLFDDNFEEVFSEEEVRDKINSFALSNKIYLLSDNDNAKGQKLKRRQSLEKLSKISKHFKYQNTEYREIENLLPLKVIKDFLFELVNTSEKQNIDKISFAREDYISIGLGQFIHSLLKKNKIKDFKNFKDNSGTLKSSYKTKLCEFVINGNYNFPELIENNKQLENIIIDLYKFINQK